MRDEFSSRVHATLQSAMSIGPLVCQFVGLSVRWLVTLSFFWQFQLFCITAPTQMLGKPFYPRPCPPARDFGSRVYGLVPLSSP